MTEKIGGVIRRCRCLGAIVVALLGMSAAPFAAFAEGDQCDCCQVDRPEQRPPKNSPAALSGPGFEQTTSKNGGTTTFRTDSGPELDFYQPCDGGDNLIDFNINVHDVDLSSVQSATLTMAVWDVDFDCGGNCGGACERDTVYINGHQLLTPVAYLTGANNQWSSTSFNVDPAFITDGDNLIEIFIDTLGGQCWCVTCDWAELALEGGRPEIEDIIITPENLKNPTTTRNLKFEAKLKNMDGYEVVKLQWSGDIDSGTGTPYTVKPAGGTHGKGKSVTAVLTYKKTATGEIGTAEPKTKEFDLFFDKSGKDGLFGFLGPDNWFKYWRAERDGACSFGSYGLLYTYLYGGDQYSPVGLQGQTWLGTGIIQIFNAATTTSPYNYSERGLSVNGWQYEGIDNVEFTLSHERNHNVISWNWIPLAGLWSGMPDTDGDGIPDEVETGLPGFKASGPGSTRSHPNYPVSGATDEEVYCDYMAAILNNRGIVANDWANPGKQTTGNNSNDWANPVKQATPPGCEHALYRYLAPAGTANDATLGGAVTDAGEDADHDGQFDSLVLSVPVNVGTPGRYFVQAMVRVAEEIRLSESGLFDLAPGKSTASLRFDARTFRQSRVDGPYVIESVFLGGQSPLDADETSRETQPYRSDEFAPMGIEFGSPIVDEGVDTDADGKYDFLRIAAPTHSYTQGEGQVEGWLFDESGIEIGHAKTVTGLKNGAVGTVELLFEGPVIRQKRKDGPYHLRFLVSEANGEQQDALYDAHVTQGYLWTEFDSGLAELDVSAGLADYGVDYDSDGLFEVLRIEGAVNVTAPGRYVLVGRLVDNDGDFIAEAMVESTAGKGQQTFALDFAGTDICKHRTPGPYVLKDLFLYDDIGNLADSLPDPYSTAAYEYTQFETPAVALMGTYRDYGTDSNADEQYEYLTVEIDVLVEHPGDYALNARLMDREGQEIVWASTTTLLAADEPQVMVLDFDGQAITTSGSNGPYYVWDVYVYNPSNTSESDYVHIAHTTKPYRWPSANLPPTADAGTDQTVESTAHVQQGTTVSLDGTSSSDPEGQALTYTWAGPFQNSPVTEPTPTITLMDGYPGDYTITLIVNDGTWDSDPDEVVITVLPVALSAAFRADRTQGPAPLAVTFTDESVPGTSPISAWAWTFGDGGTSADQNPSHTYGQPGVYSVTLRVSSDSGDNATTKTDFITVIGAPPVSTTVPSVVGMARTQAESAITAAGLAVGVVTEAYSDTIALGSVISQSPPGAASVAAGTAVALIVSKGPEPKVVPNVVGKTRTQAESAITAAGLTVGAVTEAYSDTVAAGSVISQSPAAGTSVPPGTAVALVVSKGPEPQVVPNVVGKTRAEAEAAITAVGLAVGVVTEAYSDTVALGSVVSQDPAAAASVAPGTAVALVVSKGLEPVVVPDVVNEDRVQAESAVTSAGLAVGAVTEAYSDTVAAGSVISQNPAAGASVAPSTAVALAVSKGPQPVVVPDVVGTTRAQAESDITAVGLAVGTVAEVYSDTVAVGTVISQDPAGGASVAPGTAVALVVSKGPEPKVVPDVVGATLTQAEADITAAGLAVGTVTEAYSDTVAAGSVVSQAPAAGTSVALGTAVALVVSKGPEPKVVPNVVGKTRAQAELDISSAGLTVGVVTTEYSNTVASGSVISQDPASGTSVAPGTTVALVVSKGRKVRPFGCLGGTSGPSKSGGSIPPISGDALALGIVAVALAGGSKLAAAMAGMRLS